MRAEAGPVTPQEAERLFTPLARLERIAVAVSGGADSTALLLLMQRWSSARSGHPRLCVLTVDHKLRNGSDVEARSVMGLAARLGVEAKLLSWDGEKPATGIQNAARRARLALLTAAAREFGASAVALAHNADDQAETLVMRLARGSGLDGLAAMSPATPFAGLTLVRPLLGIAHARLTATLEAAGLAWFEDPSNANPDFERVRVRRLLATLADGGLDAAALAHSARRLGRAREALEAASDEAAARLVVKHPEGLIEMDSGGFDRLSEEVKVRLLQRAVTIAGGLAGDPPRLSAIEALADWLAGGEGRARTLAGARIVRRRNALLIGREPGRLPVCPVRLKADGIVWDGRFLIRPTAGFRAPAEVVEIVPGKALGDWVLGLDDAASAMPRFVTDGRPVVVADGAPVGFAGAPDQGIEAAFGAVVPNGVGKCA